MISAALDHYRKKEYAGTEKLMTKGRRLLTEHKDLEMGIDIEGFLAEVEEFCGKFKSQGEGIEEFPRIKWGLGPQAPAGAEGAEPPPYDCIIVGAGPGGLQAAIYLGRYNRNVLLLDRSGGRTWHAKHVENYLGLRATSGRDIIQTGIEQARGFGVKTERAAVRKVLKDERFEVYADDKKYLSKFVIVSSGAYDNLLEMENLHRFFPLSFFTCVDCDGYRTTGKKLLLVGNSFHTARLAFAMKEMYTKDITLLLIFYDPPEDVKEELSNEGIPLIKGRPKKLIGDERLEALELQDGRLIPCEVIMSDFGYKLNDDFLSGLPLKRDAQGFKYVTNKNFESSVDGLFIVGPLTGNDQIVIAAGEGAMAAIEIKKRLLNL
jgi:thioredoxin reductase (NADPH)